MCSLGAKSRIVALAQNTQEVLLLLLHENELLRENLETEIAVRDEKTKEICQTFTVENENLRNLLQNERDQRQAQIEKLTKDFELSKQEWDQEKRTLEHQLDMEKVIRKEELGDLKQHFQEENEARKRNLETVNAWIREENEKRRQESEELQARLERERKELRAYIDKDNENLKDKLTQEEVERKRKEEEMKQKFEQQANARENEIIELYKKMATENSKREAEIAELRNQAEKEKKELEQKMEQENLELKQKLSQQELELRGRFERERSSLQTNIDENMYDSSRKLNDVATKLKELTKRSGSEVKLIQDQIESNMNWVKANISKPLSVYFNAYRTEDYLDGGEDYLTYSGCYTNEGDAMDPKSGIFTVPISGAYFFVVHVCTHDMKKALLTLRKNGREVASFYDQNHESNHKNSMVGQSILLNLRSGDKIQIYIFTETGLQDKPNNHLTQFVGMLLRPSNYPESQ